MNTTDTEIYLPDYGDDVVVTWELIEDGYITPDPVARLDYIEQEPIYVIHNVTDLDDNTVNMSTLTTSDQNHIYRCIEAHYWENS